MRLAVSLLIALAQWIGYPTPGIPRTAEGKPNLSAPAPRTRDGHPDLSGIWQTTSGKWLVDIAADGVDVPWTPRAKAIFDQRQADNGKDRPSGKCISHGVTDFHALATPQKYVQTPAVTIILFESYNHYRQIMTDGRPLPKDPEPAWLGYSVGKWEGNTFVVLTNGLSEKTWLDDGGHPHSDALRLTERFTRADFGHMNIQITIDDPVMYTKPWTVTMTKQLIADDELIEWMCENEKDLAHMVGKERSDEPQVGDVLEVVAVERPEGAAVDDSAGGDCDVEFPLARSADTVVELRGQVCFENTEREGLGSREQVFLRHQISAGSRPTQPLVQHNRGDHRAVPAFCQAREIG